MSVVALPVRRAAAPRSRTFSDEANVLSGYIEFYGEEFPQIPFGSDQWDFRALPGGQHRQALWVDFTAIADPQQRLVAKEVCMALLWPQHPRVDLIAQRRERPLPLGSVFYRMHFMRRWFDWLTEQGVTGLAEVGQDHCDAYVLARKQELTPDSLVSTVIGPVREIAIYRSVLTDGYREGFVPWRGRSSQKVAGATQTDSNKTPWIPEPVFEPLLAGALFLIGTPADDILAARAELAALPKPPRRSASATRVALETLIERLRAEGRPLPQRDERRYKPRGGDGAELADVNIHLLARLAGCEIGRSYLTKRNRKLLEDAVVELGVAPGGLFTPISAVETLDGSIRPWRAPFCPTTAEEAVRLLAGACLVVIHALSGMRPSEVLDIRRGCIETLDAGDGKVRYRLHSRVFKHRGHHGQPDSWLVTEQVVRAVEILEALAPDGDDQPLITSEIFRGAGKRAADTTKLMRGLMRWQNGPGGQAAELPAIPDVEGRPWPLTPRQFRRTLARQLAFRPHGVIASKVHLKHLSVTITEGYFGPRGESAAQFLAEVEASEREAKLQTMLQRFEQWEAGEPLTGGASRKLVQDFAAVAAELEQFEGTVDQRDRRIAELLAARAETLHIGLLNDCHFTDPRQARCLRNRGIEDADGPIISACEPSRCANAVVAPEHAPRWSQPLMQIENLLADRKVPPRERERLRSEKARLEGIVAPFKEIQ